MTPGPLNYIQPTNCSSNYPPNKHLTTLLRMKLLSCVLVVQEGQSLEDSESLSMDEVESGMDR